MKGMAVFQIFYSTISEYGPQAIGYMFKSNGIAMNSDICAFVEDHVKPLVVRIWEGGGMLTGILF